MKFNLPVTNLKLVKVAYFHIWDCLFCIYLTTVTSTCLRVERHCKVLINEASVKTDIKISIV